MDNEKKLPIQFFSKRRNDTLRVEAGGGDPPKWVLSGSELIQKSQMLSTSFEKFKDKMLVRTTNNQPLPLIFKVKIEDERIAKTHRKEISNLFRVNATRDNIIGFCGMDELIVELNNVQETTMISNRLNDFDKYCYPITCINSFDDFQPLLTIVEDKEDYKIKLIDYKNYDLNRFASEAFERELTASRFSYTKTEYIPGYIIYNVKAMTKENVSQVINLDSFESIFSLEPMPKYSVMLDSFEYDNVIDVKYPDSDKEYVNVGVLDSGISKIEALKPWILESDWTCYPETNLDRAHGTFVAGIVEYGDELEEKDYTALKGCKLFDASIFPKDAILSEDELISNIKRAISTNANKVKIWNLSISVNREVKDDSFSDLAKVLDWLSDKYNVLICKSAGNCKNFKNGKKVGRIHEGADSVRSLVVGSIVNRKGGYCTTDEDNPSPFSRIGRGPSYIIKPEVVHYGGNAGVNDKGDICTLGVKSFGLDGRIIENVGTSFSTPRITALAASIYDMMDQEFDPLLIKALIIHSANYSQNLKIPEEERANLLGFGKPQNSKEILYNDPNEITLILNDKLSKGEYIDIMDFPMPDCLIKDGYFTGQIVATLIYNPILDINEGKEYCQSNIDLNLGTYDDKFERDTSKRNILNPIGRKDPKNIFLSTNFSKRKLRNKNDKFALQERMLIQYKDKFYPVKKYAVDLNDLTDGNKEKYLDKSRKWYLNLESIFREHLVVNAQTENLQQKFCLLITIKDPSGELPVYDSTIQKLNEYNFWHNSIKLHSNVEISV